MRIIKFQVLLFLFLISSTSFAYQAEVQDIPSSKYYDIASNEINKPDDVRGGK